MHVKGPCPLERHGKNQRAKSISYVLTTLCKNTNRYIYNDESSIISKYDLNEQQRTIYYVRSDLLGAIRGGMVQLNDASKRKVAAPKEQKKNLIFDAMRDRRVFLEDSSSEEESDWGSDSE